MDFVVSSELETAHAISRIVGIPAARQTDVFADGQVQLGEFDVDEDASSEVLGVGLRDARSRPDSKVAAIIRGDETILPGGDDEMHTGDRVVAIGSPGALKAWSTLLWPEGGTVRDVVLYGAGRVGICHRARPPVDQGISVRMIEASVSRHAAPLRHCRRHASSTPRDSSRLPRARANRPVTGWDLRHARRCQESVRRLARPRPRDTVHDRDRARRGLRSRVRPVQASTSRSTRAP